MRFQAGKMLAKAAKGAVVAGLAAGGAQAAQGTIDAEALVNAFVAALVGALFEAGRNWLKNRSR